MNKADMQKKANEMYSWYEETHAEEFSNACEKICSFCDYINAAETWALMDELGTDKPEDAESFKRFINNGVDVWLGSPIKTMFLQ